jgi:hypothetical protein
MLAANVEIGPIEACLSRILSNTLRSGVEVYSDAHTFGNSRNKEIMRLKMKV